LSAWDDERALMAFVGKSPHRDAMDGLRRHMADVALTRWRVMATEIPLTWDDAMRRARPGGA